MITDKDDLGDEVVLYTEYLPYGLRNNFARKRRSDTFLIPKDKEEEFLKLINKTGEE